jgi:hypothetical protein
MPFSKIGKPLGRIRWCQVTSRWVAEGDAAIVDFASNKEYSIPIPLKTREFCSREEAEEYVLQAASPASVMQQLRELGYHISQ